MKIIFTPTLKNQFSTQRKNFLCLPKIYNIQPKEKISYNYPKNNNFPNKKFLILAQKT